MKLSKFLFWILLLLFTLPVFSQTKELSETSLFYNYPAKINLTNQLLSQIMTYSKGLSVNINFESGLTFPASVLEKKNLAENIRTITLKSPQFKNSILSITEITDSEGGITYQGRIINTIYKDGYEIKKSNNKYYLEKFLTVRVLPKCSLK
jgi:hypothetical protein